MKSIREIYNETAAEYIANDSNISLSIDALEKFKTSLKPGANILDVGCGSGVFADWFVQNGFSVTGLDISDEMIRYVRSTYPMVDAVCGTLQDVLGRKYDGIWCCRVFHHISIEEQDKFLDLITELLSKNAKLYITTCIDDKTYEAYDSGNGALKKRMVMDDFISLMSKHGFECRSSNDWGNGMWGFFMERAN